MAYRSAQLLSLSSGFSQSFFLLLHHAAPTHFPIRGALGNNFGLFELNPSLLGLEPEQGSSVGPAQPSVLDCRLQQ